MQLSLLITKYINCLPNEANEEIFYKSKIFFSITNEQNKFRKEFNLLDLSKELGTKKDYLIHFNIALNYSLLECLFGISDITPILP
ncbi:hypothetical protein RIR_jg12647.t2 [Rhizophagus irregularis DAOM 181602=DAOM 197198]|nr:hypothetical protein RIR_jg12647.t2 [Rhizophagus irregularis DAOM 181602=DAOM 197198]